MDGGLRTSIEAEGYVELAGENKKKNNEKNRAHVMLLTMTYQWIPL